MIVNIPGNFPMERVDWRAVLRARVATFTEQRKIGGMGEGLEEGRAGVAVEPSRNNNDIKGEAFKNRGQYQRERRKS
jgi:hypothetical protein